MSGFGQSGVLVTVFQSVQRSEGITLAREKNCIRHKGKMYFARWSISTF